MDSPISELKVIVKDPIELTSITIPSAGLVVLFFAYREYIHPALKHLPDPLSGNAYGALLFLIVTLAISLVLKRISHDALNWIYDRFYRDRKRKGTDTFYKRLQDAGFFDHDPLLSKYQEALEALRRNKNTVVAQVELLQVQSKFARSMSLILFVFAVILAIMSNLVLLVTCLALSALMLYVFFKDRWEASELVYQTIWQEHKRNSEAERVVPPVANASL